MNAGLGSLVPNVLPLDAFNLTGVEGDAQRLISLKDPWYFDGERVSYPQTGYVAGRGWWQKHADGTLVQWFYTSRSVGITNGLDGHFWQDVTWDMPIQFYANDYVDNALFRMPGRIIKSSNNQPARSVATAAFYAEANTSLSGTLYCSFSAIGRWKA